MVMTELITWHCYLLRNCCNWYRGSVEEMDRWNMDMRKRHSSAKMWHT